MSGERIPEDGRRAVHRLNVGQAFGGLTTQEKFYAHHLARAAWHGGRIIMRQVSPEAIGIFELIMELYTSCSGDWSALSNSLGVEPQEMDAFLDYAGTFLSNLGNYYGLGDQKFIPKVTSETLVKLSKASAKAGELFKELEGPMTSIPPYGLGFPSEFTQSSYYSGLNSVGKDEISVISQVMARHKILPENTRVQKVDADGKISFNILQASVDTDVEPEDLPTNGDSPVFRLVRGDHSTELSKICFHLSEAAKFAANDREKEVISHYIRSFQTGDLEAYRESQKIWVKDRAPRVENIFGFVEPYRDPFGVRAEFQGLVAIQNVKETRVLIKLVEQSDAFVRTLPWAKGVSENNGKGQFEKALFDLPDFASIHALAYCSSIIFGGINLPNYNDIRQDCGFKNVMIANRMAVESASGGASAFIDAAEAAAYSKYRFYAFYAWVVLHELFGHGTGRMMIEESAGKYNFDIDHPPIDPLTKNPIKSWYRLGQTWTGQFGDLATTVDECRADLVGAYLMADAKLLGLLELGDNEVLLDDCMRYTERIIYPPANTTAVTYNFYLLLGVDGLRALSNYNADSHRWGQAHSRGKFAILRCLLAHGDGVVKVVYDEELDSLTLRVDRSRIDSHGKPALGHMLLKLHMYRCTADVERCRAYYESLSEVDGVYLKWREIVLAKQRPRLNYVQANTFVEGEQVVLREYEATAEGIVQSWAERKV